MNKLVIIGASGHGKVVGDIAELNGYTDIVYLDDNAEIYMCGKHRVVGRCTDVLMYSSADFFVAIGNANLRRIIQADLTEMGLNVVTLIHPSAVVSSNVEIGAGSAIMAGAVINPFTHIGRGCIVNTCASVDHDCCIGDFVHISVGAHVAGTVVIHENTWIGAGATVSNNICIVSDCTIGAGAVVVKDIDLAGTYIGVPARII
jgi:sugar O-acyltransferase (sialic acid O-acetyltransferase NeuD family)